MAEFNRIKLLLICGFVLLNICQALNIKRSIDTNSIENDESLIAQNLNVCLIKDLKTFETSISCMRGKSKMNCVDEHIPGDKVIMECKIGYKPMKDANKRERICLETGEWSGSAFECETRCGDSSFGTGWNAPVFKNKLPICGGTFISEFIVLSAASCFVEQTLNGIERLEISDYDVVVGKYKRDFYIRERAQFFKLRNIFIQDNYAGYEKQFDANYAVLTLDKPIIYTYTIFPICIDLNPITVEEKSMPAKDSRGPVLGFGYTEYNGSPAQNLQIVYLPLISDEQCKARASKELLQFIRNDKFCAGYDNGSKGLCIGDDGGSISFPRIVEGEELYFIYGIASNTSSLVTKGTCDLDVYSLFTNVLHYAEEIRGQVSDSKSMFVNFIK